jgi:hypothetical protein
LADFAFNNALLAYLILVLEGDKAYPNPFIYSSYQLHFVYLLLYLIHKEVAKVRKEKLLNKTKTLNEMLLPLYQFDVSIHLSL